jgi:hypothetical protein
VLPSIIVRRNPEAVLAALLPPLQRDRARDVADLGRLVRLLTSGRPSAPSSRRSRADEEQGKSRTPTSKPAKSRG